LQGLTVRDDKNPYGDIAIKTTGLRPGEKLYEELLIGDNVSVTQHPRIRTANEVMLPWSEMSIILRDLDNACCQFDYERVREIFYRHLQHLIQPTVSAIYFGMKGKLK
jgi:FlaA1/EpsC-like NDP-sugar epimerase